MCPFVDRQNLCELEVDETTLNPDKDPRLENVDKLKRLVGSIPDLTKDEVRKQLSKRVRYYYKSQSELLGSVLELEQESRDSDAKGENDGKGCHASPQFMAKITFAINFALFCGKIVAAVFSGSLSVLSSVLDSAVDLVSGILLWFSNRAIKNADHTIYPRGRGRLEPVSIVILAVIMSLASFQVAVNSIETITTYVNYDLNCHLNDYFNGTDEPLCTTRENLSAIFKPCADGEKGPVVGLSTILICCCTIVTKLTLFLIYRRFSNSTIRALAMDHRNDVISNSIALIFGFLGDKVLKYLDPIGAVVIAFYIIITWSITATEQIRVITGLTANKELLNAVTWFILGHHPEIRFIDDLRAYYHSGEGYVVEVDIILPPNLGLKESHDIGELLRLRLERLNWVDKAYVHVDYACNNYRQSFQITKV